MEVCKKHYPIFEKGPLKTLGAIPHSKRNEASKFPHGKYDSYPEKAGNGSLVYEVNTPLWRSRRGKSRSMSVEEAESLRALSITDARQQAASTKRRRNN